MYLFLKLAWRNLFRNRRRTLLTGIAMGVGLAALIFVDAFLQGLKENMVQTATELYLGEAQIHAQDFLRTGESALTIFNAPQLISDLTQDPAIATFTPRVRTVGMITSAEEMHAIEMIGIDPEKEKTLSQFDDHIVQGNFFPEQNQNTIVIGNDLADLLRVQIGDRIVLTLPEAETKNLSQELFFVGGTFHFGIKELDRGVALISIQQAQAMLNISNRMHEIAVRFKNPSAAQNTHLPVWQKYAQGGNEFLAWPDLLPEMKGALALTDTSTTIAGFLLFGIIVFGIMNTLFMALHERTFEFGVMRACGTKNTQIAFLIFSEAGSLAVISIAIGMGAALGITTLVAHFGIDYSGIEYAGITFNKKIYPQLDWLQFVKYPFWILGFTLLASIYPAIHAARMKLSENLQQGL